MQIMYCSAGSDNALGEIADAEALQRRSVEMPCQNIVRIVFSEDPIVKNSDKVPVTERLNETPSFITLAQHL